MTMIDPEKNGWDTASIEDAPNDDFVEDSPRSRFDDIDEMMSPPETDSATILEDEPVKPDASLLAPNRRKPRALSYERSFKKTLGAITRVLIQHPATVPDAATLLHIGPKLSRAVGDYAADNEEKVGKLLGVAEMVTDNSTLALVTSLTQLTTQIVRNHEPVLEPKPRRFRIPIIKREWSLPKIGIRLGLFRESTYEPDVLIQSVLTDPDVVKALEKNGIRLVNNPAG